jgi:hypothetical protein
MILVAAVAAACALARARWAGAKSHSLPALPGLEPEWHGIYRINEYTSLFGIVLFCMTVAVFLLRLKKPRPSVPRLASYGGFLATAVVTLTSPFYFLRQMTAYATQSNSPAYFKTELMMILSDGRAAADFAGPTILTAWLSIALARRFRKGNGWIDRAGLVIGVCWLILFCVGAFAPAFLSFVK